MESVPYNEPGLLGKIAQGDTVAFKHFFETYQRRCFSYALRITGSSEAAEDVVQEIFLRIWKIRERLPSIENMNSYLHRMIHNEACTQLERVAREGLALHFLQQQPDKTADDPIQQLLATEVRDHILILLDQLTTRQREIFILSRQQGLKYEEIATRLNISFETVKTHISEALKQLRVGLTDRFGDQALVLIIIWQLGNL